MSEEQHLEFRCYGSAHGTRKNLGRPNHFDAQLPANPGGASPTETSRSLGLGGLDALTDSLLLRILRLLSPVDLCAVSQCSRVLNLFGSEDCLWKPVVIRLVEGDFRFRQSWKCTALDVQRRLIVGPEQSGASSKFHDGAPTMDSLKGSDPRVPIPVPGFQSSLLFRRWYRSHVDLNTWEALPSDLPGHLQIPRESAETLTVERFQRDYAVPLKPVVITDLVTKWPCWTNNSWTAESLLRRFANVKFMTDEVDSRADQKLRMTMADYFAYAQQNEDEDPIYLFDPKFGDREDAAVLLDDYEVPVYFRENRFDLLTADERPSFRWFIVGPNRTGTQFHVDPYRTNAWNALVVGRKRWALYPYEKFPPGMHVDFDVEERPESESESDSDSSSDSSGEEDEARLRAERKERAKAWAWKGANVRARTIDVDAPVPMKWYVEHYPFLPDHLKPIEFIQEPGELVFVPGGWWHAVLNISDTVAVTQNWVDARNFDMVAAEIDFDDHEFYDTFRDRVSQADPDQAWEDRRTAIERYQPYSV